MGSEQKRHFLMGDYRLPELPDYGWAGADLLKILLAKLFPFCRIMAKPCAEYGTGPGILNPKVHLRMLF